MPDYRTHGLALHVAEPCPGLMDLPAGIPPEIWIEWTDERQPAELPATGPDAWREVPLNHRNGSAQFLRFWRKSDETGLWHLLRYHGRATSDYLIPPCLTQIKIERNPLLDADSLMKLGMGPVLGLLLRLRGHLPLHAGSFSVGDRAGLIVGPSGSGKSTLIMALHQAGCALLADDMSVVHTQGATPALAIGRRGVQLCPDSLSWAGEDPAHWPPSLYTEKHDVIVNGCAPEGMVPLAGVFLLGDRRADLTETSLVSTKASEALVTLSGELYPPFLPFGGTESRSVFDHLSRLVGQVPTFRIMRPNRLDALPGLCRQMIDLIAGSPGRDGLLVQSHM